MLTLAFDTSNSNLSITLFFNQEIIGKKIVNESHRQAELLIPEIEIILNQNKIWYQNLNLITTINGPGSFTGVRIGLTAARTIKLATNLPLLLVNACEVAAYKYRKNSGKIVTVLDAKMDEFFYAEFLSQNNKITQLVEPSLLKAEDLSNKNISEKFLLCGSGKKIAAEILKKSHNNFEISEGEDLVESDLIGLLAYEKFCNSYESPNSDPLYLRDPKITARKK